MRCVLAGFRGAAVRKRRACLGVNRTVVPVSAHLDRRWAPGCAHRARRCVSDSSARICQRC